MVRGHRRNIPKDKFAEFGDEGIKLIRLWLERALATATPGFLQAAYPVLLGSAFSGIREMGLRYKRHLQA